MPLKFQAKLGGARALFAHLPAHALPEVLPRIRSHATVLAKSVLHKPFSNPFALSTFSHTPKAGVPAFISQLHRGFTLVELLVVITLMAILAAGVMISLDGVGDDANIRITKVGMTELRKALLQFKRDVGHFPEGRLPDVGAGVLALLPEEKLNLLYICTNLTGTETTTEYDAGCNQFNVDTARGWNGPYALAERLEKDNGSGTMVWVTGYFDGWGNRYRLYDEDKAAPGSGIARIVSFGPDGVDGLSGKPNVDSTDCSPVRDESTNPVTVSDDIVLCLVQ